jgi:acetoin utilization deacetylase AcuC-like enzyme
MRFGYSETCLDHDTGNRHPETPDRLRAIRQALTRRHGVEYVDTDPVDVGALATVHDPEYVEAVRTFCESGGGNWDPDTVASAGTWDAARTSAGLARWVAARALAGDRGRDTPFSLGRPPGHHAVADDAMGFCFFNNVVIAAHAAVDEFGADRVAVFDWDVHHGNGSQDLLYERGDVLYASMHEEGMFPGTGALDETGSGDGAGTTLNVPLPSGTDDAGYLFAFEETVAGAVRRFDPDLLLVSAGFDAHRHDPISRLRISTEGYAHLTDQVRTLAADAGAGLGFVLEGGYGLDALAESVAHVHETFDGRTPMSVDGDPRDAVRDRVAEVRKRHALH